MDYSRAWDSPIPERWTATAREIPRFLSAGRLPRVEFPDFCAMERYRAWDSVIPERWTITAREIRRFLSGGRLSRVRFSDF